MTLSIWNLVGLILGLGVGIALLAGYQRFVYWSLSLRHERAKLTGAWAPDPRTVSLAAWVFMLILLPALGFLLGHVLLGS